MQAELEALEKSTEDYKNGIEEGYLLPDGLPRLKPLVLLKKDIIRSKRIKGNEVAEKLALMDKSAINKNALKLSQEPKETTLQFANGRLEFKHAFSSYADFVKGAPVVIHFEDTTKDTITTKVLALTEEIDDVLEDSGTPTNVMFTD